MNGCQTCGGFGNRHDAIAHGFAPDWVTFAPDWVTCPTCKGEQSVLDDLGQFDVDCPTCDGDGGWEP